MGLSSMRVLGSMIAGFPLWGERGVMTNMKRFYTYSLISGLVAFGKVFVSYTEAHGAPFAWWSMCKRQLRWWTAVPDLSKRSPLLARSLGCKATLFS